MNQRRAEEAIHRLYTQLAQQTLIGNGIDGVREQLLRQAREQHGDLLRGDSGQEDQ